MSFEARRLRVQLPDGNMVAFVEPGAAEPGAAEHAAAVSQAEKIVQAQCIDQASFNWASCLDNFTQYLLVKPGSLLGISPVNLPLFRQHLEAQLKGIDDAQRAAEGTAPAE
jgi:hypothetical protein